MSNYAEYRDRVAFHPGYYVNEAVEASGLTQADFARRLDTTPKNLSLLIRGEQSLSLDMAMKLSRMMDTSVEYWMNLQIAYDALIAAFRSDQELEKEREVFASLDYGYFRDNFCLPDLPRRVDEQIAHVRKFLGVSTLAVLRNRDLAVSFRSAGSGMSEGNIIKANAMVQIAINRALKTDSPKFCRRRFEEAVKHALTLTESHDSFLPLVSDEFLEAGVKLIILENMPGSKTNGASKPVGESILLMISSRRLYSDTFWFTLLHEAGHIMNHDFGISFENDEGREEEAADRFAMDSLIPPEEYRKFIGGNRFGLSDIRRFAKSIGRDPAIVLGRLQHDGLVGCSDRNTGVLRRRYRLHKQY